MSKLRALWVRYNPFITPANITKAFRKQAEILNEIADVQEEAAFEFAEKATKATNEAVQTRRFAGRLEELIK